jgi:glycosyltransferase involved in cell wall biosynthesis
MSKPTVSVIICCYTEERLKDIREALESVLAQMLRPHEVIISVDHNKRLYEILKSYYLTAQSSQPAKLTQQTERTLSNPQTKVVLNEGAQGLSETRNVGIRTASGDIVAFIDDDALAEPNWLENLVRPFQPRISSPQSRVVAVGGQAIPLWPNSRRPSWFPEELDWIVGCTYKGLPLKGNQTRNVLGCNMAFRKGVFGEAGLFKSETGRLGATMGCGEEADLCLRISHAEPQALILFEAQAIIHHKVTPRRTTWRYLWQRCYNEGFYKAKVQKLHQATQQTLSTEDSYLRYLLFKSIPERLARFYRGQSLLQIAAIIVCIAATGTGYLAGRTMSRSHIHSEIASKLAGN